MKLVPVSADDPEMVERFVALANAVWASDVPWHHHLTPYRFEMNLRHGWDGEPGRHFIVEDGQRAVGTAAVFTSDYDNLDHAWTVVQVQPDRRRQGYGTRVRAVLDEQCEELGRNVIGIGGWDHPRTRGFAQAQGLEVKSVTVARRQTLSDLPRSLIDSLYGQALKHAVGYELVRVAGRLPEEWLDEDAAVGASINDAPMDDIELEDEVYSAERTRAYETAQLAGGMRMYRVLAREVVSGRLAGHTVAVVDGERPELGFQHDTAVAASHRGHRLGLLMKADLVRWWAEAEPELRQIDTFNAESNDPMVAVNRALGYRVLARELLFQHRLG